MSKNEASGRARTRLMLEICRRYYLHDESMVSIGERLEISRFKVARLLQDARDTGLVTISLHSGGEDDEELSRRVARHLGLRRATVIEAFGTPQEVRQIVGVRAGRLLAGALQSGETLGLGWGRTLVHMIESIERLPNVQVLQLSGAVGSNLSQSPIELVRKAALIGGNNAKAILAPLYINDPNVARVMRSQPDIADVLELFDSVTTAAISVGSFVPASDGSSNNQFLPLLPETVRESILAAGAIAEVCGTPYRQDGSVANRDFLQHIVAITPEQLSRVPRVIAVASDSSKAGAIWALSRAGVISELVIDADLAESILAMPPIDPHDTK
jgi:DNA-binding transcriptional regulator LsrR (DeoR family)